MSQLRVGLGSDIHRLITGRPLILGGVEVEFYMGLDGHSDADVLLHALIDALLGAAGLGDIGEWFPNTDDEWAGADSTRLLAKVLNDLAIRKWKIVNIDCTINAEKPRMKAWKPLIRTRLSQLCDIAEDNVNVKAKSGEKVGPIGRGEAISAEAIVLLSRTEPNVQHAI
ncbi:2-C-methyl-D-erythritol 2,4-cyclodiphosphate synthase [bacterium]|nr:2-C-methyl-D-erythritol 2,4-cyclodiphosphate synthase [bacterium]